MQKKYLLGLLSLTVTAALYADVKLPEIFSNHAVLQRSKATAIFGKADAGENITVTYGDIQGKTIANKDGKFIVKLDLSKVGKTANDLIVSGKNKIVIKDVIVGEVWLCTGQSNMAMRLATTLNARNEIKNSANNYIRMFLPKGTTSIKPIDEIKGQWLIALPQNAGRFTAVGYYFAKKLNKEAGLSVGLINPSWGGSTIETWICKKHLNNSSSQVQKTAHEELDNYINYNAKRKDYLTKLLAWEKSVKWVDDTNSVAPPKDAKWQTAPAIDKGIAGPGIYWLQRTVDVNAKNISKDSIMIWLGRPTVAYKVFWDGKLVYEVNRARSLEKWPIRAFIKTTPGKHTLQLRVSATDSKFYFYRENSIFGKSTATGWQMAIEKRFPKVNGKTYATRPKFMYERPFSSKVPEQIFNALIHPIKNYTIKGNLWYQGESNTTITKRFIYGNHITALVNCFRETFNNPELPFYAVQLPEYSSKSTNPNYEGTWPIVRVQQTNALNKLPFAKEVVIFNTGEASDIHPIEKLPVGERLAAVALKNDYGKKDIICDYPQAVKAVKENNKVRVSFINTLGGLKANKLPEYYWLVRNQNKKAKLTANLPQNEVEGFTICGNDGKWFWANAKIEGNDVIVYSPKVTNPAKVRYAFQNNPTCNLFSNAQLPVGTFELIVK